ncbi:MAG TPA: SDR family oxidoreductase, partial [Burkholderiales bacterium]|nr:SDR family oxidoreductase [Burkholderiales bacterium]
QPFEGLAQHHEFTARRVARIPLGFMGDGRDTAHAVLFLASDEARFITGTEIVVDGGMTARCD